MDPLPGGDLLRAAGPPAQSSARLVAPLSSLPRLLTNTQSRNHLSMTPAYVKLASEILRLWQASLEAGLIAHPRDVSSGAPAAAADLNGLGRRQDPFGEPFAEGTFVGKLESDEAGEEGLYNVVVRHQA